MDLFALFHFYGLFGRDGVHREHTHTHTFTHRIIRWNRTKRAPPPRIPAPIKLSLRSTNRNFRFWMGRVSSIVVERENGKLRRYSPCSRVRCTVCAVRACVHNFLIHISFSLSCIVNAPVLKINEISRNWPDADAGAGEGTFCHFSFHNFARTPNAGRRHRQAMENVHRPCAPLPMPAIPVHSLVMHNMNEV